MRSTKLWRIVYFVSIKFLCTIVVCTRRVFKTANNTNAYGSFSLLDWYVNGIDWNEHKQTKWLQYYRQASTNGSFTILQHLHKDFARMDMVCLLTMNPIYLFVRYPQRVCCRRCSTTNLQIWFEKVSKKIYTETHKYR